MAVEGQASSNVCSRREDRTISVTIETRDVIVVRVVEAITIAYVKPPQSIESERVRMFHERIGEQRRTAVRLNFHDGVVALIGDEEISVAIKRQTKRAMKTGREGRTGAGLIVTKDRQRIPVADVEISLSVESKARGKLQT